MPTGGVTVFAVTPLPGGAGSSRAWAAWPMRAGLRGRHSRQKSFQVRAGEGLAAVVSACVEVRGEVGEHVQAGHRGGGGDGPDHGGEAGGGLVAGAVGVLPGHDRAAQRPFRGIIIVIRMSE